jgi:hypothetical protein
VVSTLEPGTEGAEWLEMNVVAGFRVWQIMFLCLAGLLTLGNLTTVNVAHFMRNANVLLSI